MRILRVPISVKNRLQFASNRRVVGVAIENWIVQHKRNASRISEIVSGPIRRPYEGRIVSYHIFVVIDSGKWNFSLIFVGWYYETTLKKTIY